MASDIKINQCYIALFKFIHPFQKKEPVGADDALPDSVTSNLAELTKEACEPLTVTQIKRIRVLIDDAVEKVSFLAMWESHNLVQTRFNRDNFLFS